MSQSDCSPPTPALSQAGVGLAAITDFASLLPALFPMFLES